MKYFLVFLSLMVAAPAWAANSVSLSSEVFVERVVQATDGQRKVELETPKVVVPGDKLIFILSYTNEGAEPAADFVVTNPLPTSVVYESAEDAVVSVDGGAHYGALAELKIKQADGSERAATAADVTHIRWTLASAIPAGGTGKLSFRGVVK